MVYVDTLSSEVSTITINKMIQSHLNGDSALWYQPPHRKAQTRVDVECVRLGRSLAQVWPE